jgi:hypothetical protein
MLLDDLVQCWGHAEGLPRLRVGMTTAEARAAVGGSMLAGDLRFTVGDPTRTGSPVALSGIVRAWREIELSAQARSDLDEGFWGGASLVAEYLASEIGAPAPRAGVGRRGQKQLRVRHRGVADGVPVEVKLFAEGVTEDGTTMELSLLPERSWVDLIGDAIGVGAALSSLVLSPGAIDIPSGGSRAIPSELDGSHVEVLHAVDGAIRVRISEGRNAGHERPYAWGALTNIVALLERRSARHDDVAGLGHPCTMYRGLAGPAGAMEVQLSQQPAKGWLAELLIRAR